MSPAKPMKTEIAPHILSGECRYRDETLKLDRILCVDAPGDYPVKTLTADGCPINHRADGESPAGKGFDLLPLAPEPRVAREWMVSIRKSDGEAYKYDEDDEKSDRYEVIRVREVLPEQEASEAVGSKDSVPSPLPTRVEDTGTESASPAFKVGDRVVTHEFNSSGFVPWMREFVGKAGRIVLRSPSGNFLVHRFWWPASALTLVEEPAPESEPEVRYYTARGWLYRVKARHPKSVDFRGHQGAEWEESLMYASDLMQRNPGIVETDAAGVPLEGGEG